MADKITRFEDYVNKEARRPHDAVDEAREDSAAQKSSRESKEPEDSAAQKSSRETKEPEQGLTQEILSIEIEDPVQFFTEEERQEYYAQMRRKETEDRIRRRTEEERAAMRREQEKELKNIAERREPDLKGAAERPDREKKVSVSENGDEKRNRAERRDDEKRPLAERPGKPSAERPVRNNRRDTMQPESYEDDYDEEFDDEEYMDDDESSGVNMDLVVRIASIITGVIILVFIGIAVKVKVYDRYFAPDPDETETVVASLPAGYTATDDTVIVTGASSLNLRTVPSTGSKEYIAETAPEGTELKRIAVSEDGSWALVEYNGQQLYGSMSYLRVK